MSALAVSVAAIAAAGCGGGSDEDSSGARKGAPKTVSAWVAQFQKAVEDGGCKELKKLAPFLACSVKDHLGAARVAGTGQFGSGAVVDFAGTKYPRQGTNRAQVVLAQRPSREWIAVFDAPESTRQVDTSPPASTKPFTDVAAKWAGAVASGDCKTAYKYAAVGEPEATYCRNVTSPTSEQRRVLDANAFTTPETLGGTADILFLRYVLQVPKSVNPKGGWSYATVPVVHASKAALANGATNPYLVGQPIPGPTPANVKAQGPYTKAIRDRYVRNSGGGAQARCEIDMIATGVPYPDFAEPTERFDDALQGIRRVCRESLRRGGTADERAVAQVVLAGDLVAGYICFVGASTDRVVNAKLGGSRQACAEGSFEAPPDPSVELKDIEVTGDSATATGTDKDGRFTVKLIRQDGRWLVDDFVNEG